jgi:hypothetical protein
MDAIREALAQFKIPNAWWPKPLIDAVQHVDIASTIPWVGNCILDYLSHQPHDVGSLLIERIQRAVATTSADEVQAMLDEYDSRLHPFHDNLLVSYRHLIQAKQFLLRKDITGIRTQIVWALLFLGDCDYSRQDNIRFITDNFSTVVSDHSEGLAHPGVDVTRDGM